MHLTPREIEKLMLHNVGFLAQKRLARGVKLNHPEAIALITTQVLEMIRDGKSVAELMDTGRQMLGRRQVLPGVAEMLHEVQVEGTFPDGTKLVTVHHPVSREHGDLELALYGSFLPVPDTAIFEEDEAALSSFTPGACEPEDGAIELNAGRATVELKITNTGDRPVQVGSHYHFIETNAALSFDREASFGKRLDIPAGTAVRFEPGESKTVTLVDIAGEKKVFGGNNLVDGDTDETNKSATMQRVAEGAFGHSAS